MKERIWVVYGAGQLSVLNDLCACVPKGLWVFQVNLIAFYFHSWSSKNTEQSGMVVNVWTNRGFAQIKQNNRSMCRSPPPTLPPGPRASSNMCPHTLNALRCALPRMHKGRGQCAPLDASRWSRSHSTPCFALPLCALLTVQRVSRLQFACLTLTRTRGCCVCGRSCWHREHQVATVSFRRIRSSRERSDSPGSFSFRGEDTKLLQWGGRTSI